MILAVALWNDRLRERLPQCFEARPAEGGFGLWAPARDGACAVHRDHRVQCCVDDQAGVLFAGPQFFLGSLLLGDVLQRAEPAHLAVGVDVPWNGLDHLVHVDPGAVGALQPVLDVFGCTGDAGRDARVSKRRTVFRMHQPHPLARALRHARRFDPD